MKESNGTATTANGMGGNTLNKAGANWFLKRGIDPETVINCGIFTQGEGKDTVVVFPFIERGEAVNHKYRAWDSERKALKRFTQDKGARKTFWNHGAIQAAIESKRALVITEGEMDALAAMEAGCQYVVSVPDGAPAHANDEEIDPERDTKFRYVWNNQKLLEDVSMFILAGDGDEPGRALNHELQKRLGPERCKFITYPDGCKDLNDVLVKHGGKMVRQVIDEAKDWPVKGLYQLSDFPDLPNPKVYSTDFPCMDEHIKIELGRLMVVTGVPNHGKSEWVDTLAFNLAKAHDWHICVGSFENEPMPGFRNKMRKKYLRSFTGTDPDTWTQDHFSFISQNSGRDDDLDLTLEHIVDNAEISVMRYNTKVLILDPWNEIEHMRGRDESETDYVGRAIRSLKRFAKRFGVFVVIVAHPTKMSDKGSLREPGMYDISGSQNWANKPDYGVVVWRPDITKSLVQIKIKKVRFQEYAGVPGMVELDYDRESGLYEQYVSKYDAKQAS